MIDVSKFEGLAEMGLGPAQAKVTSLDGDQFEAEAVLWTDDAGTVEMGVWECTPGRFTSRRDGFSELCHILTGRVTISGAGQVETTVGAGEVLVLPAGWNGVWTVHELTRKLYVINHSAPPLVTAAD